MLIAIDPGYNGGIAIFDNTTLVMYLKMPIIDITTNRKKKKELDISKINKLFSQFKHSTLALEKVYAYPGMDIQSMFRFGEQFGILKALAVANDLELILVDVKQWKKFFNLKSNKKESINLANKLYNLNLKSTEDGIAEAILIGTYVINKGLNK